MTKAVRTGLLFMLMATCVSIASADFMNVPYADFKGDSADQGFDINCGCVEKKSNSGHLYAGVHFPNGAIIKNIRLLAVDYSLSCDVTASLLRTNMYTFSTEAIFTVNSSGASGSVQAPVDSTTDVPADRKVYNNVLAYGIQLYFGCGDEQIQVLGVVIEYE